MIVPRTIFSHIAPTPTREPTRLLRRRMAETILRCVTTSGAVTEANMRGAGFSQADIDTWFPDALQRSGVTRLAETL